MTTFTDPTTVQDPQSGNSILAAWGDQVNTDLNALANRPSCRVYNNAAITGIAASGHTALTFNSERYDNAGIHSTSSNTGRLTVPTGWAGVWHIFGAIEWDSNNTGVRQIEVRLNGATLIAIDNAPSAPSQVFQQAISTEYKLAVGDYVELCVFHTAGSNRQIDVAGNFSPEFGMTWQSIG